MDWQSIIIIFAKLLHIYRLFILMMLCSLLIHTRASLIIIISFRTQISMEGQKKVKPKKFRELNDDERRKLIESAKKKNAEGIVVIAECHPKCKVYEELPEFRYIVAPLDKVKEIDTKIKKKIAESDKRIATQSVFLFSQNKLLNRETSFEQLYNKHKNFKDEVLYLYFANVESF